MIPCIEYSKDLQKDTRANKNEVIKVAKIQDEHENVWCLNAVTINRMGKDIKQTVPFIIASKRIKQLGLNLT